MKSALVINNTNIEINDYKINLDLDSLNHLKKYI